MNKTIRILIVEDERITAIFVEEYLKQRGYEVIGIVSQGEEAIQLVREKMPDMVLMDISLKGEMDGIEASRIISGEFHIPVIFTTAASEDTTLQRAKKIQPYGYINKPIRPFDLYSAIETASYRYNTELSLRVSEEKYRQLYQTALVGMFQIRIKDGVLVLANDTFLKIFGQQQHRQADDIQMRNVNLVRDYIPVNTRQEMLRILMKYGRLEQYETEIRLPDGTYVHAMINAKYYRHDKTVEGTLIDISALIDTHLQNIKEKEARIQSLEKIIEMQSGDQYTFGDMVGKSPAMTMVYNTIRDAAESDAVVLITGETGTGKELVALAIHSNSNRSSKRFLPINCGALPENIIESELFGYEPGAFTGATRQKIGKFEFASGGTLFLDEIGELTLNLQVKLLRVLQEKKITRLGGNNPIDVDVRIIAATNRQLEDMIEQQTFREDLYYRLNIIPIHLPPLRERKEDIVLLAMHFINKYNIIYKKQIAGLTESLHDYLLNNYWKGNVRELENYIERMVVLSKSEVLDFSKEPMISKATDRGKFFTFPKTKTLKSNVDKFEKEFILDRLRSNRGQITATARELNVATKTLYRKIQKYNIRDV